MSVLKSAVGRKVIMAVTGFFMVFFVLMHLLGNSTIFIGPEWINSYAEHLHDLPVVVWPFRGFMFVMLCLHVFFGITLTLENWGANPGKYAVSKKLKTTFAGKTMIWTGLLLLAFILFHLLHFTLKVVPEVPQVLDELGRFDVYTMMVAGLLNRVVAGIYIAAMIVLFLHTSHGIQSIFQTIGLNNERTLPKYNLAAKFLSAVFLIGFSAIPVLIVTWIIS
ncbi:MAG: succinate dehydrogenase cytochrome b subunit [bacterium]|nr:MAG: succinate dehydrogenase cytochrome b subunit [bacterium]